MSSASRRKAQQYSLRGFSTALSEISGAPAANEPGERHSLGFGGRGLCRHPTGCAGSPRSDEEADENPEDGSLTAEVSAPQGRASSPSTPRPNRSASGGRRSRSGTLRPMRDTDVRPALVAAVARRVGAKPHVLVPEVDVRWSVPARMDALLVADRISGFEIKSDVDSLTRLPRQIEAYGAVVERAVLVVGDRHLAAGTTAVPEWWTIWGARWRNDTVVIREVRRGRLNPSLDPLALTTFMSRDDLSEALRARGFTRLSTYSVDELRQLLAGNVSPRETVRLARAAMLGNALWRHRSLLAS